jgi:hypothetical protein
MFSQMTTPDDNPDDILDNNSDDFLGDISDDNTK